MQQSDSLCLAVNPPPFDKGGKGGGARRGIIVLLQWLWGMAVLGAMGGASSSPTKSERDSAENLIDGADGEQSPPSRLGIVSEL